MEPMISLAFGLQSRKGAYALLLGSGVSRSAGIPTGWEITLDLIRKIAALRNESPEDPAEWYRATFGREPDYSSVMESLARNQDERQELLRRYFEPTPEERVQGRKVPQPAHRAIAKLVKTGTVRFIITTNFDRLIEQALEAEGVTPRVIKSNDDVMGAPSIALMDHCVFKIHGDYLDRRILNTPSELSQYAPETTQFLDAILDQFGLIVCGWSGKYDTALCDAIRRSRNRRFTMYWTTIHEIEEPAQTLVRAREADVIRISDADTFFTELADKVAAIEEYGYQHPLSANVAVASVKRYIESHLPIRLRDTIRKETERVFQRITGPEFSLGTPLDRDELLKRIEKYEIVSEVLSKLVATGCYWNRELPSNELWVHTIERLANQSAPTYGYYSNLKALSLYPALRLIYAGGIAAVAAGDFGLLRSLLVLPGLRDSGRKKTLLLDVYPGNVMGRFIQNKYTPWSDRLCETLFPILEEYIPDKAEYEALFDRFEILFALVFGDLYEKTRSGSIFMPPGRFGWKCQYSPVLDDFSRWAESAGDAWEPLRAGLFDGSRERYITLWEGLMDSVRKWGMV